VPEEVHPLGPQLLKCEECLCMGFFLLACDSVNAVLLSSACEDADRWWDVQSLVGFGLCSCTEHEFAA
jgi:hypothetical protein